VLRLHYLSWRRNLYDRAQDLHLERRSRHLFKNHPSLRSLHIVENMGNPESSHSQHYEDTSDTDERNQNFAYIGSYDDNKYDKYDPVQEVDDFAEFYFE